MGNIAFPRGFAFSRDPYRKISWRRTCHHHRLSGLYYKSPSIRSCTAAAMTKQLWEITRHAQSYQYSLSQFQTRMSDSQRTLSPWKRREVTGIGIRILQDGRVSELSRSWRLTHPGPPRCTISVQLVDVPFFLGRMIRKVGRDISSRNRTYLLFI